MGSIRWNPFASELVILKTAHTPDACAAIIRSNIYHFWTMADNSAPFIGSVRKNRFTLVKNTPHFRNAVRPVAYGTALPDSGSGTSITIRLTTALVSRLFLSIPPAIFAFMLMLSTLGALGILSLDPALSDPFLVLFAGVISGAMFYRIARKAAVP